MMPDCGKPEGDTPLSGVSGIKYSTVMTDGTFTETSAEDRNKGHGKKCHVSTRSRVVFFRKQKASNPCFGEAVAS